MGRWGLFWIGLVAGLSLVLVPGWLWSPGTGHMQMMASHMGMMGAPDRGDRIPSLSDARSGKAVEATLALREWSIEPQRLALPGGQTLKLTVRNEGAMAHALVIPGLKLDLAWIRPGESRTVEISLPKSGTFEYFCNLPGHKEAGQKGILVVES